MDSFYIKCETTTLLGIRCSNKATKIHKGADVCESCYNAFNQPKSNAEKYYP
jgi:hypothetical protein